MSVTQVRLPDAVLNEIDLLVKHGYYSTKSDVVRDAVRRLVLEKQIGSVKSKKNSVKEVRNARKILSNKNFTLKELNKF